MLTEEYIKHFTLGVYQFNQAESYTREHLDSNGDYLHELYQVEIDILHVKIGSRFTKGAHHNVWIGYGPDLKLTEGQNPISDWYCDCKAGARVFGMCAHITSIIWFLGIGRHQKTLLDMRKSEFFLKLCLDSRNLRNE